MTFEDVHCTAALGLVPWVLGHIDLTSADSVADLGAGDGRFSIPIARELGKRGGMVYAVDSDAESLRHLQRIAEKEGLIGRIRLMQADIRDQDVLPPKSMDVAMLNFVLNLIANEEVEPCILHTATSLRRGGHLLISGWIGPHTTMGLVNLAALVCQQTPPTPTH